MGRHNGTWAKFHPQMHDHPKTAAAVRVLVEAGVPVQFAGPIVVSAVPSLAAWALSDGDSGSTAALSDARFLAVAWPSAAESRRWSSAATGALLRRALREAGYLDAEADDERIHGFAAMYADLIGHRERARAYRQRTGTEEVCVPVPCRNAGGTRTDTVPSPRARPEAEAEAEAEAEEKNQIAPTALVPSKPGTPPGKALHPLALAWNRAAATAGLPTVTACSPSRRKHADARLREADVATWERAYALMAADPFCQGQNDRAWRADFDYALRPEKSGKWLDRARSGDDGLTARQKAQAEIDALLRAPTTGDPHAA